MRLELQSEIQTMLEQLTSTESEHGIQVAVYEQGHLVVDAAAGHMGDPAQTPIDSQTLFPVFSCSKAITAILIHRLCERGILDLDQPIATYWPEFAQNNKADICLRHVLDHTAGLWALPSEIQVEDALDWSRACQLMCELRPAHPPGQHEEYHAITFGWILGELACRASGQDFQSLLGAIIKQPLALDDCYMGLPDAQLHRVATLYEDINAPEFIHLAGPQAAAIPPVVRPLHSMMNRKDMQQACIPATSGISNAQSLAKIMAALLPSGVNGKHVLSPQSLRAITAPSHQPEPPTRRLGFITLPEWNAPKQAISFGHGGYGGSIAFAVPEPQLAVAITKNHFNRKDHTGQILKLLRSRLITE